MNTYGIYYRGMVINYTDSCSADDALKYARAVYGGEATVHLW